MESTGIIQTDVIIQAGLKAAFAGPAQTIGSKRTIDLDEQTTVSGNQTAHDILANLQNNHGRLAEAVNRLSDNIVSIHQQIAQTDKQLKDSFQ